MEPKTIAHFRNGVGNFIILTSALQALALMDESKKIDICTDADWFDSRKKPLLDIWEKLDFINKVYSVKEVQNKNYKVWFWTAWNSGGESLEFFKSKKYYEPPKWNILAEHECDYYMAIVREVYGYKGETPKQIIVTADTPIIDKGKRKIITLANGGFGELCTMKKWNKFGELAHEIKLFFKDDVCLIKVGHRNELVEVKDFDIDYVNQLMITQSANVIRQSDLVICDDTGNMHIADALGIPTIVLWGGSIVAKNRPINCKHHIIRAGIPCQPCQIDGNYRSCTDVKCMDEITVGEVMYTIRKYFREGEFNV